MEHLTQKQTPKEIYDNYINHPTTEDTFTLFYTQKLGDGVELKTQKFESKDKDYCISLLESIMNLDFNYSVNYHLKEASYYSTIPVLKAYNNESNDFGFWAEPDILSLKDRILEAAENKTLLQEKGIACADWIRANETYNHTAKRLLEIVRS